MDFLEKGRMIIGEYYSELINRFDEKLKETRPHLAKKKVLFHHDNVSAHPSGIIAAKLHELRYKLLSHSIVLARPRSLRLLSVPNMKMWLAEKKVSLNEEIIVETEEYSNEFELKKVYRTKRK